MFGQVSERRIGITLGFLAGFFAAAQVLVMVDAARAGAGPILSLEKSVAGGFGADPMLLLQGLLPVLVATYLSMLISGAIMLYFAWCAGRLAAGLSNNDGKHTANSAAAGGWVALVSAVIWMVLSVVAVSITHMDGTASGIFTSDPLGPLRAIEVIGILGQELCAAFFGFAAANVAGLMGARTVRRMANNGTATSY